MYKLQACSKSHGDKIQQILLAAYWCLLHSHLDEEPHQESLPPGQGKAWEGLPGASVRPTLLQRLAREEDEEEEAEYLADLHL